MRKTILVTIIICATCAMGAAVKSDIDIALSKLTSKKDGEREGGFRTILSQRKHQIQTLISIVQNSEDIGWSGSKQLAIRVLAELRAREATLALLDNLMFLPKGGSRDLGPQFPTQAYYPSARALLNIGLPAVNRLIVHKIRRSSVKEERDLATWVIMEIEGREQALYRFKLLAERESIKKEKVRLEGTISYIKNYKPKFDIPGIDMQKILKNLKKK